MEFEYLMVDPTKNPTLLRKIRQLLYQVYIQEGKWEFRQNTPSELRIINDELRDKYDDTSLWFIVKHKDDIVACARMIDNADEIKSYCINNSDSLTVINHYSPIVEGNRFAVKREYRKYGLTKLVVMFFLKYVSRHKPGYTAISATSHEKVLKTVTDLGAKVIYTNFKYEDSDNDTNIVYVFTPNYISKL